MSTAEIFYRANQYVQKSREKGNKKIFHQKQDFNKVFTDALKGVNKASTFPIDLAAQFQDYNIHEFFGQTIDLQNEIDWHLDLQSGKRFPLTFSKDIDIRFGKYGSAKIVWEINRLQFLLPLAIKYRLTKNEAHLLHWMYLMRSWVNENPYLKGINWYSNIEINIRLIVWYFCWQILWVDDNSEKSDEFIRFTKEVWLPSIYDHCVFSISNPSKYSSANNHLIAEYSGLFVAAICWPFKESAKWSTYAQKGLEKEIIQQHSENGINREEASEYIQFITDLFLIPFAIAKKHKIPFSETYENYLNKIFNYIVNLLDVKGGYAKYGDEDDGKVLVVSINSHSNNFLSLLISGAVLFKESKFKKINNEFDFKNWLLWGDKGKCIYENLEISKNELRSAFYEKEGHFIFKKTSKADPDKEIYLHFDAAPLGFLSIAAHGHADALSIALTLDGNPIFVDAGTYTYYIEKEWRKYFVSTLAHNTICIDNVNQAEYIGPTMWLQHYDVEVLNAKQQAELEIASARHSGYNKIGCSHERTVEFNREKEIFVITDQVIVNKESHKILQPWQLHPEVMIEKINNHTFILQHNKSIRRLKIQFSELLYIDIIKGQLKPILGWYSPSFLHKEPSQIFYGLLQTNKGQTIILTTLLQIV
jgi:hypothetical protein